MLVLLGVVIGLLIVLLISWVAWVIISALVVGAIIGGLARLLIPGRQEIGFLSTILIGWIGSFIGGLLGRHAFHSGRAVTYLLEIAVAAVLVLIASSGAGNAVARRTTSLRW
jgi:uncharacterized membrane protein YeaQ/YmgE (transglycosylase-associated protein family)